MRARASVCLSILLFLGMAVESGGALAQSAHPGRQEAGGLVFAYGLVPAEVVLAHADQHPERQMHGGARRGQSHLFLALFDAKNGTRIAKADVGVHITLAGGASSTIPLEPMTIAGQPGFGAFVSVGVPGTYVIRFDARRAGTAAVVSTRFDHRVLPERRR